MNSKRLYDLINMDSPEGLLLEAEAVLHLVYEGADTTPVKTAFSDTRRLYAGEYPGYKTCTTGYHDFQHSVETLLALVRLIHGAAAEGHTLAYEAVQLAATAALLHDSGYVQEKDDTDGAGGKHTATHVSRSLDFAAQYGSRNGFPESDISACKIMIRCTDLEADFEKLVFPARDIELLGKMLAAADLLAQMADRAHLEKLFYLYQEFQEGMVSGYNSAEDMLRKTIDFYTLADDRFTNKLENVDRFMAAHFKHRWGIQNDLYRLAIENEKAYLRNIARLEDQEMRSRLRRKGIVDKLNAEKKD
jgi:hypothetical protein